MMGFHYVILMIISICPLSAVYGDDATKQSANPPRLLIISLDGFRHDYLKEHSLPNIQQFGNEGVRATHGMQPTFTTMTYPNHISIATGMFQEEHGIVHNTFWDRLLNKTISMGSRDEGQWSDPKVEPIWITATKQQKKSAVLFWPACHNEFHGVRPLIYSYTYTDAIPLREKMDNAIRYFKELPMELVLLYHFEPDKQGHTYGPDSVEMRDTLIRLDGDIKYLMDKVRDELNDSLNIMILSDHGMTNVTKVTKPFFERFLNRSIVESTVLAGALFNVMPRPGQTAEVISSLERIPNVTVYKREEMPERFHYSKPEHRLGDIIALPNNEGHILSEATTNSVYPNVGNHGWDNTLATMQAIFMARGPDFSKSLQFHSLTNVDVYHIVCKILHLTPNPYATAGSIQNLTSIFRTLATSSNTTMSTPAVTTCTPKATSTATPTIANTTVRTVTVADKSSAPSLSATGSFLLSLFVFCSVACRMTSQ